MCTVSTPDQAYNCVSLAGNQLESETYLPFTIISRALTKSATLVRSPRKTNTSAFLPAFAAASSHSLRTSSRTSALLASKKTFAPRLAYAKARSLPTPEDAPSSRTRSSSGRMTVSREGSGRDLRRYNIGMVKGRIHSGRWGMVAGFDKFRGDKIR